MKFLDSLLELRDDKNLEYQQEIKFTSKILGRRAPVNIQVPYVLKLC